MDARPIATPADGRINWYFLASLVLIYGFICTAFPSLSYRAEMHWETGVNFFDAAYHQSLWDNVRKTDMGYLPWIPRLISVVAIRVLGVVDQFPVFVHLVGAGLIALFSSYVNLRVFRTVIPSDPVRFLAGLGMGFGLFCHGGAYNVFNLAYFGAPVLVLLAFVDKQALGPLRFGFHLGWGVLITLSKSGFVIFTPLWVAFLTRDLWARRWKSAAFHAGLLLACSLQTQTLMESRKEYADRPDYQVRGLDYPFAHTGEFLSDVRDLYQRMPPYALVNRPEPDSQVQMTFALATASGLLLLALVRLRRWNGLAMVSLCLAASLAAVGLLIVGTPAGHPHQADGYNHPMLPANLWVWLAIVAAVSHVLRDRGAQLVAVSAMFVLAAACRPTPVFDWSNNPDEDHSQWHIYRNLLKYEDYFIPVNGAPWGIAHGCFHLNWQGRLDLGSDPVVRAGEWYPESPAWRVRAVMFELGPEERERVPVIHLAACDDEHRPLAWAVRLTEPKLRYQYFLFEEPTRLANLHFLGPDGRPQSVNALDVRIYGRVVP